MQKRIWSPRAIALLAFVSTIPLAQGSTDLTMATFLPATHYGVTQGSNVFIHEVETLSDHDINVTLYPAEQIGKARQLIDLVKAGAVDVAEVATAYVSNGELPLLGVLEVPGLVDDVCAGSRAIRAIGEPGGPLHESDIHPAGLRVVNYYVYSPYGPAASRREIKTVEDLQGLKMRSAGGLMEMTIKDLGGVPLKLSSPEIAQSLQRGTLDAVMMPFATVNNYALDEYAHYGATGYSMGTPGVLTVMSETRYQSLPEDVRADIDEAGLRAEQNFCEFSKRDEAEALQTLESSGRLKIHTWSDAQVAELDDRLAGVSEEWVKQLEARGKPAAETLERFTQALQAQ